MSNDKRKVYVVGHKNPDTDSICTAIAYANLKTKLTQIRHEPRRAGQLNEETQYVLERFGVKVPLLLSDLREQIKDVDLRESEVPGYHLSSVYPWHISWFVPRVSLSLLSHSSPLWYLAES